MSEDNKRLTPEPVNKSFWFEEVIANTAREYASGEVIGATGSLTARGHTGGGIIRVAVAVDRDNQSIPLRIWFFRRQPTIFADSNTFAIGDNDEGKLAGYVDITSWVTVGSKAVGQNRTANLDFSVPQNGELYYTVEARGAGTMTAVNRLRINFGDWPD